MNKKIARIIVLLLLISTASVSWFYYDATFLVKTIPSPELEMEGKPTFFNSDYCLNAADSTEYLNSTYRWVKVTCEADFAPRDGAGALVFKDSLWLIGGWNPKDTLEFPLSCNNEVWNSYKGKTWNLVKENTFIDSLYDPEKDWEGRHTAGYVVFNGKMWIIGGDANQGHYQNDIWNSENGRHWEKVIDSVPWAPRVLHYTVVFDDKIWVIGGQTLPQFAEYEELFYADVWNSEDGLHWNKVESEKSKWLPRGLISGRAIFKNRIWILGGSTYDTPIHTSRKLYNDVWSSKDGKSWDCHTQEAEWDMRNYHSVAVWDEKLWVFDGTFSKQIYGVGNTNEVWFSENGEHWTELKPSPWKPRHASSVFVKDDVIYLVAGNNMESDVWKLEKINPF